MSLLGNLVQHWGQKPELTSLVPADSVILGEPIRGWAVPGIAFVGYDRVKQQRGSLAQADLVTLRGVIEAPDALQVENVLEAMIQHLFPAPRLAKAIGLSALVSYSLNLGRVPASEHFVGEWTVTCHYW